MKESIISTRIARQTAYVQTTRMAELGVRMSKLRSSVVDVRSPMALGVDLDACIAGDPPGPDAALIATESFFGAMALIDAVVIPLDIAASVAQAIHDNADKACKQDFFGTNASTACVPFATIYHVLNALANIGKNAKSLVDDAHNIFITAVEIAETYQRDKAEDCRNLIKEDTGSLVNIGGNANDALERVEVKLTLLKSLLEQNQALLLIPQGKRDDFPMK